MAGVNAKGTQLRRDTDGAGTFATIANVSDINGPEKEREAIEVTAHDSPDDYREFVKGLKDGGEVTVTINYDPGESDHTDLDDDFEEDDLRDYQVRARPGESDERTAQFSALITSIGDSYPVDDRMEREVTFKVSGKPTIT